MKTLIHFHVYLYSLYLIFVLAARASSVIPHPPFLPPCVKCIDNVCKDVEIGQDLNLISCNSYNYHI